MSKINVLDEHLTNMIAAGEVVERPMGVVKELVENSIDAQATKIEVRLTNGGLDCLQVTDDGIGMDRQDATKAFNRHATSKISEVNDLWRIKTMGFRGEALPSIASVSKTTLTTCDGNDSTQVRIEYGKLVEAKPMAFAQGTSVKVEGLFYKTPARLKHLKSANTETNMVFDLIQKMALGHPEIAFELYCDDRLKIQTNGSGSLQEVIMNIYGLETAKKCIPVSFGDFDFQVDGYIVSPSINRSTRQYINCYVNGRVIRSLALQKAIIDGYHGFMMPDKFPICVLNISIDNQLVDVNVHPSKWEIRISKERQLYSLLTENIAKAIRQSLTPSDMIVEHIKEEKKEPERVILNEEKVSYQQQEIADFIIEPTHTERFSYLTQLHGRYILACDEENLYIVDQHAAQERCMYEEIQNDILNKSIDMQPLLVPLIIDVTPATINRLEEINEQLACINVEMEPFSASSVIIREVPVFFEQIDETEFMQDLIDEIINDKKMSTLEIRKEKIASLACHSSVKFNKYLSADESKKLLSRLSNCNQPFNCPHGRPTMISISEKQLEKEFKRV